MTAERETLAEGHPHPSHEDWNEWATFANHVSDALWTMHVKPMFSQRQKVAEALWALGYRPTAGQIAALVERQHRPEAGTGEGSGG